MSVILGFWRWHTPISCLDIVTPISFATSTLRWSTSSSLTSETKIRMLWRRPYCSFESAQNKLVVPAIFDGGDVLHSANPEAAQNPHERRSMRFLCKRFCNHLDIYETQSLPSGPVPVHWMRYIGQYFLLSLSVTEFRRALMGILYESYETIW